MTDDTLTLTSTAFENMASIPAKYTCDGEQVSPPLAVSGIPAGTVSLALIMDDPDIPAVFKEQRGVGEFVHWVLYNVPPQTKEIASGAAVGVVGANGAGKNVYAGPCPPPQYEPSTHRYFFKLYALDQNLPLQAGATKADVERTMAGHIIAETQLVGTYKRK
ncbi:MAG TPA: YbhB/YbcL family Raf kinase inhibitor-like protein [Candidatus Paceibacterota bacterium]